MSSRTFRPIGPILLLSLGATIARGETIDPKNPPVGRFADDWAEIYMAGGKVGYYHSAMTRRDDLIDTEITFHMRMGRVEQPVTVAMTQKVTEKLDGTPVTFSSEMDLAKVKSGMSGVVENGKVRIAHSQFGMETKQEYKFPEGAVMTWGTFRETLLRGFKPGTTYTTRTYTPDMRMDDAVNALTTIGDWETFTHEGQEMRGQKMSVKLETPMGSFEMISWLDKDAMPIVMKMPLPGLGDMVIVTTDQKTALADFVPPEFFMKTVVKADRKIDYKHADRIVYRLKAKEFGVEIGELPETGSQRVLGKKDGAIDVEVVRQKHDKGSATTTAAKPLAPASLEEFLSGNSMINVEDPELKKLAKQAAGDEKDPYKLANKLREFVTEYVSSKNLNIGFATASEVARNKEGDCSEHGVLLAAVARINGLPSRVVVGLAYVPIFGNQDDIFGYHMWTQVYIDGRWVDIDAALRETTCSPIRIAFATSSLKSAGLADLSLPLLDKIGAIDIDVLEIK
jgi:hypothetical protein